MTRGTVPRVRPSPRLIMRQKLYAIFALLFVGLLFLIIVSLVGWSISAHFLAWANAGQPTSLLVEEPSGPWRVARGQVGGKVSGPRTPFRLENGQLTLTLCHVGSFTKDCKLLVDRRLPAECLRGSIHERLAQQYAGTPAAAKLAGVLCTQSLAEILNRAAIVRHHERLVVDVLDARTREPILTRNDLMRIRRKYHATEALVMLGLLSAIPLVFALTWVIARMRSRKLG